MGPSSTSRSTPYSESMPQGAANGDPPIAARVVAMAFTSTLGLQHPENVLQLHDHLLDQQFELGLILPALLTLESLTRAPDGETLVVKQPTDLADHDHVLALVIAPVTPPLDR